MTLRATIVGAGGLGGPISLGLARTGIELTIIDPDVVELSNLHRQIQFTAVDLGAPKAARLAGSVVAHGGVARGIVADWTLARADEISGDADLIIDASDDPETKFAVADWAVANGRRYVIAAALRYGGNVMAGAPGVACYRCLFEEPAEVPSCADAGVLGPVVGAIGSVAAAIALGLVHGDRTYAGALLAFDDLRKVAEPRVVRYAPRPGCPACARAPISPLAAPPVRVAEGN
ncbi:MAG: ThiF family adenylyltransferase [Deltaproteobacteria bacterium]|nr:ThiF family adenylyltransferase [Deltaproteobacteria bacterium]